LKQSWRGGEELGLEMLELENWRASELELDKLEEAGESGDEEEDGGEAE